MAEPFPHVYAASAQARPAGEVAVQSPGLATIVAGPAPQFGGTGAHWSPETLLPAAIANCFVLTFRATSAASLFGWLGIECRVEGVVERVGRRGRGERGAPHELRTTKPASSRSPTATA